MLKHQKTARYCLKLQKKEPEEVFHCKGCERIFTRKDNYTQHVSSCFDMIKQSIDEITQQYEKAKTKIAQLEKELTEERGRYRGYEDAMSKHKSSKTVNNYINPKLLAITTDTIRPFTIETVKEEIEGGGYTREMFNRGTLGIVEFVSNMISYQNEDGTIERNYVCTDVSRSKFHRLLESNEWRSDNGAHFLNGVLDHLSPDIEEHYLDIVEKRRKAQAEEDEVEYEYYNNRVDESRPLYQGVKFKKGEAREKLFISLRNKISRIAAV